MRSKFALTIRRNPKYVEYRMADHVICIKCYFRLLFPHLPYANKCAVFRLVGVSTMPSLLNIVNIVTARLVEMSMMTSPLIAGEIATIQLVVVSTMPSLLNVVNIVTARLVEMSMMTSLLIAGEIATPLGSSW